MRYRLFVSSVALLLTSGGAFAADPVIYQPPEPPAPTDAPFSWEGPYFGLHGGYAWGRENDNQSEYFPHPIGPDGLAVQFNVADQFNVDGFLGGIHLGHNWQRGSFVYGVEADLDHAGIKGAGTFLGSSDVRGSSGAEGALAFKSDWQGSLRGRVGYAAGTWHLYATGGLALARGNLAASGAYWGPETEWVTGDYSFSDKQLHLGWTVGAGIEKAFTPNLIGRLEARYADFGSKSYNLGHFGEDVKADWHQATVTVGLSYKF